MSLLYRDFSFKEIMANVEHFLALGHTRIHVENEEFPWELATLAEHGNTFRLHMPVNVDFEAVHSCGLTFYTSLKIEPRDASGSSLYQLDTDLCIEIAKRLPAEVQQQFADLLLRTSAEVYRNASEYAKGISEQFQLAYELRKLIDDIHEGRLESCQQ